MSNDDVSRGFWPPANPLHVLCSGQDCESGLQLKYTISRAGETRPTGVIHFLIKIEKYLDES